MISKDSITAATFLILNFFLALPGYGNPQASKLHLMPMPYEIQPSEGQFRIGQDFTVSITGYRDSTLTHAVGRMLQRMKNKTGLPLQSAPVENKDTTATMQILCQRAGEKILSLNAEEDYRLEVTSQFIRMESTSPIGILRGLETFLQLIEIDHQSFFIPVINISDHPRFRWRGLHIDVSRHWIPMEVIRQNLDAMAAVKLNVLHWHLSDDQGFRVESLAFPKLHQVASEGNYYTQKQIKEIVAYARDRGIRVVPEFDMPGHTTAWLTAYPELASAQGPYAIERAWGVFDPCMDPTREKLYIFLDSFIGEMAKLFPDEYFHIGGDEVNGKQWNANPKIQAFKKRNHLLNNHALQAYFNRKLQKILIKHGKIMIGWDEILHPDLPKTIVVQSWRSKPSLADSLHQGYMGILSRGYYLDHMQPAAFHYMNDPEGKEPNALSEDERKLILGGEACMWAEFVTENTVESRIWPRAAAIAERLWSRKEVQDIPDMYRRLEPTSRELELLGVKPQSHYIRMLQIMVEDDNILPIKSITDLLKPVGLGIRQRIQKYYSFTPLNRLTDILPPESETARQFEALVDQIPAAAISQSTHVKKAKELLLTWQDNAKKTMPLLEQSFLLKENQPAFMSIAEACRLGLEAIQYLETHVKPPVEWKEQTTHFIEKLEKTPSETTITILPAIKKLMEAAQTSFID
jgi:hexosaminidase